MFSAVDSLVQYVNQEPIILMLRTGVRLSNVPISGMHYLQHLGLDGELEGNLHGLMEHAYTYLRYKPVYHPPTYSLQIPHISLSCTVCDKDIWVFVEFTKGFPKTFNIAKENVYAI